MITTLLLVALLAQSPIADAIPHCLNGGCDHVIVVPVIDSTPPTPVSAPPAAIDIATHIAISAHVVAQFADVATTEYALGTGRFTEANPLMKWASKDPIPMALIKGSFAVATTYFLVWVHKQHPRFAFVLASSLTAITAWAAHANAQAIRAHR